MTKTKIKTSTKVALALLGTAAIAAAVAVSTVLGPTLSITNMNPILASGGSVTLNWNSANTTTCTASAAPYSSAWTGSKTTSGSQTITSVKVDTVYTLSCLGTNGTAIKKSAAKAVIVPSAPVINISANPNPVVSGQTSKLSWTVQYANTCTPSNAWAGSGSKSVPFGSYITAALTTAKTYTLSCTGPLGTTSKSVTVTIGAPVMPTVSLSAAPVYVTPGYVATDGSVTLTWSSTNAATCIASAMPYASNWTGSRAVSGTQSARPASSTQTYRLTCTGAGGTAFKEVGVGGSTSPLPVITSFSASKTDVLKNESVTLTWTATNATSCYGYADPALSAWNGPVGTSPKLNVGPLSLLGTYTFDLTCKGPGGISVIKYAKVTVGTTLPVTTVSLSASASSVAYGGSVTLTWNATRVSSCNASNTTAAQIWSGSEPFSGSLSVGPITANTTYNLSCRTFDGLSTVDKKVAITVDPATIPPPVPPLASTPSSIKNVLVILWDPHRPDQPQPSKTYIESQLFGTTNSVVDYYRNQSGGKVGIRSVGVLGWYDADKPADHYWYHPADANDGFIDGHVEKWTEAILKADKEFDFSKYDVNNDGTVNEWELGILMIIPQKDVFGTVRYVLAQETPTKERLVVDGVKINAISEVYTGPSPLTGFGVLVHELGHQLFGFPDMYQGPFPYYGFSIMDAVNPYFPGQVDPYNKYWQGWLTTREITSDGYYLVNDVEKYREVLKITKPGNPKEFFLIENRQHGTYDQKVPDLGIAIWDAYDDRTVGDWGRKNIIMIVPDRKEGVYIGAAWHGPGGTNGYDLRLKWRDGSDSGITVKEFPASSTNMKIFIDMPTTGISSPINTQINTLTP